MADLLRELRDLSKEKFELFVHQFLLSRFPGAEVKRADGTGGDAGVDSFSGLLSSGPAIWQCKHFTDRVRRPQRSQILDSIKTAFAGTSPSVWTLCVPGDLRTEEHRWFQDAIVRTYGGPDRIKLLQGSDFLHELMNNRPLRDLFFPESAISEIRALRAEAILGDQRSAEQTEKLLLEIAHEYLGGKMDVEPRLKAVVVIGDSTAVQGSRDLPGLVMSFYKPQHAVHLIAKDPASFNLSPIEITANLREEAAAVVREAFDLGMPVALVPGNVLGLSSSSPLLNALIAGTDASNIAMEIRPHLPEAVSSRIVPLRFVAGTGDSARELFFVPFNTVRMGRREIELLSRTILPVEINIVLRMPRETGATVNFRPILPGADLQHLDQVLQFLEELERSGDLEVLSPETNTRFLKEEGAHFRSGLTISDSTRLLIANAALVSRVFSSTLKLPPHFTEQDVRELRILTWIATGAEYSDIDLNCAVKVSALHRDRFLANLDQSGVPFKIDHYAGWRRFEVFGQLIDPGPISFVAENASFVDPGAIKESYLAANEGDLIPIRVHCVGPCRWKLMRDQWDPQSAVVTNHAGHPSSG